jgi:hypothetical protein
MGANARWKGTSWLAAMAAALLLGVLLFRLVGAERATGGEASAAAPPDAPSRSADAPPRSADAPPRSAESELDPMSTADGADEPDHPVDLGWLRQRLPDNLYWKMGAPTQDPDALEARAEEARRWNDLFGKVQSNTASEEEIQVYYDHLHQVSEDYIEFARAVIEEYGDKLPERDRGLYELSIEMHRTRLAELPRRIDGALTRKREHDERREKWRREKGND